MCHGLLRKALSDAVRWGLLLRNVGSTAPRPPSAGLAKVEQEQQPWTLEELRSFLAHVRPHRLYAAFLLAATTGMRRGEILGLRWSDVDFERAILSVTQTLIAPKYQLQFSTPKTARGTRAIALDAGTMQALQDHRLGQMDERRSMGLEDASELVFCREDQTPVIPQLLTLAFQAQARAAGVPVIRFHDLRHTHATLALQAGVHPKVVSERLGHSSASRSLLIRTAT